MAALDTVRDIVARHTEPPPPGEPLQVDSLVLVSIVEDLEEAFDLRVRASELDPDNFGSVEAIAAFVARKGAT